MPFRTPRLSCFEFVFSARTDPTGSIGQKNLGDALDVFVFRMNCLGLLWVLAIPKWLIKAWGHVPYFWDMSGMSKKSTKYGPLDPLFITKGVDPRCPIESSAPDPVVGPRPSLMTGSYFTCGADLALIYWVARMLVFCISHRRKSPMLIRGVPRAGLATVDVRPTKNQQQKDIVNIVTWGALLVMSICFEANPRPGPS